MSEPLTAAPQAPTPVVKDCLTTAPVVAAKGEITEEAVRAAMQAMNEDGGVDCGYVDEVIVRRGLAAALAALTPATDHVADAENMVPATSNPDLQDDDPPYDPPPSWPWN